VEIPLVQVSTDYVFAGDRQIPWKVDDPVAPLGVYGASKLGGELTVRTSGARHAIVSTAWVVSAHGSNFMKTMLRVGAANPSLRVVEDQRGSPTGAADLAQALMMIAVRLAEIFRQSALRGGPTAEIVPIATVDYPTSARRPANSLLRHTAITAAYGITPRPWADALGDILDKLIRPPPMETRK
jgi:dTDP-4-dehydrorhamnose reductase